MTVSECKDAFARAVAELVALGYFEEAFGSECDDSHHDPTAQGQRVLSERLGLEVALWPLSAWSDGSPGLTGVHKGWSTEVFFDVIEALDELVARPQAAALAWLSRELGLRELRPRGRTNRVPMARQ